MIYTFDKPPKITLVHTANYSLLQLIRVHGPISRTDLLARSGRSKITLAAFLRPLTRNGLVTVGKGYEIGEMGLVALYLYERQQHQKEQTERVDAFLKAIE